jgi:Flp pilus assembly pilin Flp
MPASRSLSDRLLHRQVAMLNRAQDFRRRLTTIGQDEKGQTPTEYLMIVGLMAAVIVMVFTVYFWPTVKTAASSWVAKVSESILGTKIDK